MKIGKVKVNIFKNEITGLTKRQLIIAKIPCFGLIFFILCSILFWDIKIGGVFGLFASFYYFVRRSADLKESKEAKA